MTVKSSAAPGGRKVRAVFVLPTFDAGGAERVLITLMNGLPESEFEKTMIVVDPRGTLGALVAPGTAVAALNRPVRGGGMMPALYQALRRARPDVVVSTMAGMNFKLLLLRPFFPQCRFIVREAITPSYFLAAGGVRNGVVRAAYRILYPLADMVISPSQAIIDEFSTLLKMDMKRHRLLCNPVDEEKIRGGAFTRVDDGAVHFVAAGRLHPQKGYDRLLTALAGFAPPYDWRLTILGEGEERPRLEALVRAAGLERHVSMPGLSDFPWAAMASAHALLLPSRYEGLPNVALEALACGTPVIATAESGGIGEIAAQARPGAVTVAADMDAFIGAMRGVVPAPITQRRESLLPPAYARAAVLARFRDGLTGEKIA